MIGATFSSLPKWSLIAPPVAVAVLAATWGRSVGAAVLALVAVALVAAVIAAVHHAESVAHHVGEPLGTLILAVAVTVIEVGLIVMLMSSGGKGSDSLARDTVFAAFMIVCNGVIGICLLVGTLKHRVVVFRVDGVTGALATLSALATLCLVLPSFTASSPGGTYSGPQLAFAGVASLILYGVFVFVQTVRHRSSFLPIEPGAAISGVSPPGVAPTVSTRSAVSTGGPASLVARRGDDADPDDDADGDAAEQYPEVTTAAAWTSLGLLVVCLIGVVGLAKTASPAIERAVSAMGAPQAVVGVAIALLVLLPETTAAVRAAARNRIQTSLNLAFGSALASIGLTIPSITVASIWLTGPLVLGLAPKEMVLLAITVVVSVLTVAPGRATLLQGAVHLAIFGAFLFLAVTP